MLKNDRKRNLVILGGKVTAVLAVTALVIVILGSHLGQTHADGPGVGQPIQTASTPTDMLNCNQQNPGPVLDTQFVNIPNVGNFEIDSSINYVTCSQFGSSNMILNGLIEAYPVQTVGGQPTVTYKVSSTVTVNGINGSWSAGIGATGGVSTGEKPSAGANVNLGYNVSSSSQNIATSSGEVDNTSQPVSFSYQNLHGSCTIGLGGNVTENDTITVIAGNQTQTAYTTETANFA